LGTHNSLRGWGISADTRDRKTKAETAKSIGEQSWQTSIENDDDKINIYKISHIHHSELVCTKELIKIDSYVGYHLIMLFF
jgi:hypothetical protein